MSPRMRKASDRTFSSLKIRNYRLYFVGQLVSVSGTWIQWVAQTSLIVYTLHKGGVVLGIATGLQFLPMFVGGMWGGIIADRYDKRTTLIWTQALQAVLAGLFGALVLAHVIQVWQIYLLAFLFGVVTVVDMPARQAFVSEMVGSAEVPNAVALNSAMFNSGRLAGPALAAIVRGRDHRSLADAAGRVAARADRTARTGPVARRSGVHAQVSSTEGHVVRDNDSGHVRLQLHDRPAADGEDELPRRRGDLRAP